ncbi:DUF2787 family protein [Paraglaciecola sp. 20A4]|uniref:DUF2787 family protein n=1 Tax=Paraglaciecola sp. 20A4 TaxID=2687288 RepID=UPI0014085A09
MSHIQYEGLALPVSKALADAIVSIIPKNVDNDVITINFRDPTYSPESGGFHPVEIRLENRDTIWHFCYITDFAYLGMGGLAKELDFDFQAGVFQNFLGIYPIEQASDMYQIWEGNFLHYWQTMHVYKLNISS